jgi:hypothetical protein
MGFIQPPVAVGGDPNNGRHNCGEFFVGHRSIFAEVGVSDKAGAVHMVWTLSS